MSKQQESQLTALMREMGTPPYEGFDPMPPSQHSWFLDAGESATSRAIAWAWSKTIAGKGRKRTARCHDERGDLTATHLAADLGWPLSFAIVVLQKLEAQGRVKRDEKGRIQLRGDVPEPRRIKSEEENLDMCTHILPEGLRLYFEQLPFSERSQYTNDYLEIQKYRKRVEADAMALARARAQDVEDRFLQAIGYNDAERKGRPRLPRENLAVQLELTALPEISVHISGNGHGQTSVQNGHGNSYENENGSVHKTASLVDFSEVQSLQSEVVPESVENVAPDPEKVAAPAPRLPDSGSKNPSVESEKHVVIQTLENELGRKLRASDPLREGWIQLGAKLGIPDACVVWWIEEKVKSKKAASYHVTLGALYQFALEDLPEWKELHRVEIQNRLLALERARQAAPAAKVSIDTGGGGARPASSPTPADNSAPFAPEKFNAELKSLAAKKGMP